MRIGLLQILLRKYQRGISVLESVLILAGFAGGVRTPHKPPQAGSWLGRFGTSGGPRVTVPGTAENNDTEAGQGTLAVPLRPSHWHRDGPAAAAAATVMVQVHTGLGAESSWRCGFKFFLSGSESGSESSDKARLGLESGSESSDKARPGSDHNPGVSRDYDPQAGRRRGPSPVKLRGTVTPGWLFSSDLFYPAEGQWVGCLPVPSALVELRRDSKEAEIWRSSKKNAIDRKRQL